MSYQDLSPEELYRQLEHLKAIAQFDELTGLYHRSSALPLIEAAVSQATPESTVAILMMDLDEFKLINDTLGHNQGDMLLKEFASLLRQCFRKDDILCRMGGDEFCVVLRGAGDKPAVGRKAADFLRMVREMYRTGYPIAGSCSIGGAFAPADGSDFVTVSRLADAALYQVKSSGKNSFMFFGGPVAERDSNAHGTENAVVADGTLWTKAAQRSFQILYRTPDAQTAFPMILDQIGKLLCVGRIGFYELKEDGLLDGSLQWQFAGLPALPNELPVTRLDYALRLLERDGVFVCSDTSAISGLLRNLFDETGSRAVLLSAVVVEERLLGFYWTDYCSSAVQWGRAPRSVLTFLTELTSITLLRERKYQHECALRHSLESKVAALQDRNL